MYKNYEMLLEKTNTTSYAVAKATGISQATLSDWKTGKSTPKADKLMKIAKFFGVPMEELMDNQQEE